MVTIQETKSRALNTPAEIAEFLQQRYDELKSSGLKAGDAVDITARAGIPSDFAVGDVAVYLYEAPGQPFTYILALNANGREMVVQVQSSNLSKRVVS